MTIDNAPVEQANRGIDRRTLLKAGAWAAPVIVVAAAVPAASASPSVTAKVIVVSGLNTQTDNNPGKLIVKADVKYDPNKWPNNVQNKPASATVSFRVDVINSAGQTTATNSVLATVINANGQYPYSHTFTGLPAGRYDVNLTVTSVIFPAPFGQSLPLPSSFKNNVKVP